MSYDYIREVKNVPSSSGGTLIFVAKIALEWPERVDYATWRMTGIGKLKSISE
jgi:hypothetical protein